MMFDSWIEADIYLVDAERYANMHWRDIGEDMKTRYEIAERNGEILVVRFDYRHIKDHPEKKLYECIPYSYAILQYAMAVVAYDEEESRWLVVKNRYHDPARWKGSDRDLCMKMDNHMMEMLTC